MSREGMRELSKYDGMLKIHAFGLPHPDWLLLKCPGDLPENAWTVASHGWTIRTCPMHSYQFGLPSKHRLTYAELKDEVSRFAKVGGNQNALLVYPSWEFDRAGCCSVSLAELVIEVVRGDIAPLLRGKKSPEAVFIYEGPYFVRERGLSGTRELLSDNELRNLRKSCRDVIQEHEVVLEWTITRERELFFHDWQEIVIPMTR